MGKALYNRTKSFLSCRYKVLIVFAVLLLQGCTKEEPEIRILFTGDILLSRNVELEIESRKSDPWSDLRTLFKSADLVIGNLEGAVGKFDERIFPESEGPVFNIKNAHIPLLTNAGFNVITFENNHSNDLGTKGKQNTFIELQSNHLSPVSFDNSPRFFRVHDIVIGIVTINLIKGRDNQSNDFPSIGVKQKLRLAKSLANIVVVSIHWGDELLEWPSQTQRSAAKWLVRNGADLIIGSHPHVIQKPEMVDGKPVFFSLGNHLFDQKYLSTKQGMIADCRILNGKLECKGIITHTKKNSFYPEVIEEKSYDLQAVALNSPLKIGDISIKPVSVIVNNQAETILEAYSGDDKLWHSHPISLISITKGKLDGKNDFLMTLEKYYSSLDGEVNLRPYVYTASKMGLVARWRGSALAWPMLDAVLSQPDLQLLCALHRGDSFINLDTTCRMTRVLAYKWNGFGFAGVKDEKVCESCKEYFQE